MTLIYIENQLLDAPVIPALLTYQLDDVKDFASRNTTFSKTIIFPGTANNNKLFGHYFESKISNPNNPTLTNVKTNFNAAKSAKCVIMQDNIQTFKGVIRLLEVVVDGEFIEYETAVFGELGGFMTKLGSLKISDLDFSAYDHTYSIANIAASFANAAAGSGYYYPLIDYGTYSTTVEKHDWKIGTFRPALFVKEYWEKMFAAAGYTYDCTLSATTRFKSLIIPNNTKELYNVQLNALQIGPSAFTYNQTEGATKSISFGVQNILGSFAASAVDTIFTYSGTPLTAEINGSFVATATNLTGIPFTIRLYKNGVVISSADVYGSVSSQTVVFFVDDITFNSTDTLTANVTGPPSGTWSLSFSTGSSLVNLTNKAPARVRINLGEQLKINSSIPQNILQRDFFTSILRLFNLYVYEDPNKFKHLIIAPFIDFFLPVSGCVNWDAKIDRGRPYRLKPMSEINARYYNFKFKTDADYYNDLYQKRYNEGYGDRIYDSEFEFAGETNSAEVIFSATPLVGYTGEDKVYSTIFKQTGSTVLIEENTDSNIRILQARNVSGVGSWNIRNATNTVTLGSYTTYPYAGHLNDPDVPTNDIHFGVPKELFFTLVSGNLSSNQFNVYWSPYMAEITDKDSKLMKCTARLNITDILNLNFGKYVWVDGSLWRLNKIIDYDTSDDNTCEIELLKVIYTTY